MSNDKQSMPGALIRVRQISRENEYVVSIADAIHGGTRNQIEYLRRHDIPL